MDDGYKNVSLDQALLPGADNPLLPSQFIPNAAIGTFKIVGHDTVTVNRAANTTIGQLIVPHTLGYTPTLLAFLIQTVDEASSDVILYPIPRVQFNFTNGLVDVVYNAAIQKDEIDFTIEVPVTGLGYGISGQAQFQYFLLKDQAQLA